VVPEEVARYGADVVDALRGQLGDRLVGACFVGSIALGGYVPGESDVDVLAVCEGPVADAVKPAVADAVVATTPACPARGLELTLYRRDVVASPPVAADFEVNANGGPRMDRAVHLDPRAEHGFWYVIDRAIAHRCGVRIAGPPPGELFVDVSRRQLLDSMMQSMRWHRRHEPATLHSVLNAARAWRFAIEDVLGSKLGGAAWARTRWPDPGVIDAAVDLRHGRPAVLDERAVEALLDHVEAALAGTG
jgi:hypothetical protein